MFYNNNNHHHRFNACILHVSITGHFYLIKRMRKTNNMADNEDVIELSDGEESSEKEEPSRESREHGSGDREKNLQPLENATSVVWKIFGFLARPGWEDIATR